MTTPQEPLGSVDADRAQPISEQVVRAQGAAAYGYFESYASLSDVTCADFLSGPGLRTPVFVRFTTAAGSPGSADTVRDVRGFATKFFTRDGDFDLVGTSFPVFFDRDGAKFPDSVHDALWEFVSLAPENLHAVMWLMSDRALPRSYRMMPGFGVHTFRFVDADGRGTFVKFHWRPTLGAHCLVWDEAQKIAGQDPDFHLRDLRDAIEAGSPAEYELCVQLIAEADQHSFGFDLLDATKLVPEELVPLRAVGRMVLDRNPDDLLGETEQAAFRVGNVVPGIELTDDPLLQARLSSDPDARPADGAAARRRLSPSFADHYSQARLFWNSMADWEKQHIVEAFRYELGQADRVPVRQAILEHLADIDRNLATAVAAGLGLPVEPGHVPDAETDGPDLGAAGLSLAGQPSSVRTRKVAVLAADGLDTELLRVVLRELREAGAVCEVVAPHGGEIAGAENGQTTVDRSLTTTASVLYDAVLITSGEGAAGLLAADGGVVHFVTEAYKHGKPIGAFGDGVSVLRNIPALDDGALDSDGLVTAAGVVAARGISDSPEGVAAFADAFATAIAEPRHFDRHAADIPA